jgi:uncharacterized membrane protein
MPRAAPPVVLAAALAAACGGSSAPAHDHAGSGATCPPGSTLRYQGGGNGTTEPADFGQAFFATCVTCHASALTGLARSGAPVGFDFDTLAGIRLHAVHIDAAAAAGPDNPAGPWLMPPAGGVAVADRSLLGQWLACGAP